MRKARSVLCMVLLGAILSPCPVRASEGFEDLVTVVKSGADEKAVLV